MNSGFISGNEAEWIELIEWLEFNWINARNESQNLIAAQFALIQSWKFIRSEIIINAGIYENLWEWIDWIKQMAAINSVCLLEYVLN